MASTDVRRASSSSINDQCSTHRISIVRNDSSTAFDSKRQRQFFASAVVSTGAASAKRQRREPSTETSEGNSLVQTRIDDGRRLVSGPALQSTVQRLCQLAVMPEAGDLAGQAAFAASEEEVLTLLENLRRMFCTPAVLEASRAGAIVFRLCKSTSPSIAAAASTLYSSWQQDLRDAAESSAARTAVPPEDPDAAARGRSAASASAASAVRSSSSGRSRSRGRGGTHAAGASSGRVRTLADTWATGGARGASSSAQYDAPLLSGSQGATRSSAAGAGMTAAAEYSDSVSDIGRSAAGDDDRDCASDDALAAASGVSRGETLPFTKAGGVGLSMMDAVDIDAEVDAWADADRTAARRRRSVVPPSMKLPQAAVRAVPSLAATAPAGLAARLSLVSSAASSSGLSSGLSGSSGAVGTATAAAAAARSGTTMRPASGAAAGAAIGADAGAGAGVRMATVDSRHSSSAAAAPLTTGASNLAGSSRTTLSSGAQPKAAADAAAVIRTGAKPQTAAAPRARGGMPVGPLPVDACFEDLEGR